MAFSWQGDARSSPPVLAARPGSRPAGRQQTGTDAGHRLPS
jgi:hypothetical protein